MTDSKNALFDKFIDLANQCFAEYHGSLEEKVAAWCYEILSKHKSLKNTESLEFVARNRAIKLLSKIQKLLSDYNRPERLLFPKYLDVKRVQNTILVGDVQLGYMGYDIITGKVTKWAHRGTPVIPPSFISLYLYVSWAVLCKIIAQGRLKASIPRECNDLYEFLPAWQNENEKEKVFEIVNTSQQVVLCFSRTPSSPVMWGHYGDYGRGAVLRFKVPVYRCVAGQSDNESLLVVAESEKELEISEGYQVSIAQVTYSDYRPPFKPSKTFYEYSRFSAQKGTAWSYEEEMRIVFNYDENGTIKEGGKYFTSIMMQYLDEVILGARNEHSIRDAKQILWQLQKDAGRRKELRFSVSKAEYNPRSYTVKIPGSRRYDIKDITDVTLYRRIGLGMPYNKG